MVKYQLKVSKYRHTTYFLIYLQLLSAIEPVSSPPPFN